MGYRSSLPFKPLNYQTRRMAHNLHQPPSLEAKVSAQTPKDPDKLLEAVMARHHYAGDALIEILHAAQEINGYLCSSLLKQIARKLRLPPSRVLGVATFYHLFRFAPAQKHTAALCVGTACYVEGSAELAHIIQRFGWTIEAVRCAGSCGLAPLVVCDGFDLPRVTPTQLEAHLRSQT